MKLGPVVAGKMEKVLNELVNLAKKVLRTAKVPDFFTLSKVRSEMT